jgi:4-hydroxyacetophenone monooxygenase
MGQVKVSEDDLRSAVDAANIPILLMVLVQLTGEQGWLEAPYSPSRTIGMDDNDSGGLSPELQQEVRTAAGDAIVAWYRDGKMALEKPGDDLLVKMLSICMGEDIPDVLGPRISETLKTSLHPEGTAYSPIKTPPGYQVVIIGGGFSGLCMAARLSEAGVPFLVLEKSADVGGVWWGNRYPGAGVDTPSYLYSLSFVPYNWSRYYAGRDEVHGYLHHIVDRFNLSPSIRLQSEVLRAVFDEARQTWVLDVRDEHDQTYQVRANIVVSGVGIFNPPVIPKLPGLSAFRGPAFHTAEWPEENVDLKGKKVGVLGNGASAMQTVPAIAGEVSSLVVFQRSPHWVAPFSKFKANIPDEIALLLREVPVYRAWFRERQAWIFGDRNYRSLHKDPTWQWPERSLNAQNESHRRFFEKYLRKKLGDRQDLIEKLLPPFPPFAKRMLLDNGWFDALLRDNVALETDSVAEVVDDGVITSAGTKYELDVLIFATGFGVTQFISTFDVVGKGGLTLREAWNHDDAGAYLGMTVPGFPNFFMMYGPNINGGGGSVLGHLESQVHYIVNLLRQMTDTRIVSVECRSDVYEDYNDRVAATHEKLIYTHSGVNTYYRNSRGRVVVQNPFSNVEYWRMTRCPQLSDYVIQRQLQGAEKVEAS